MPLGMWSGESDTLHIYGFPCSVVKRDLARNTSARSALALRADLQVALLGNDMRRGMEYIPWFLLFNKTSLELALCDFHRFGMSTTADSEALMYG